MLFSSGDGSISDIDYEKLAMAIIKAQEITKKEKKKHAIFRIFVMKVLNFLIYAGLVFASVIFLILLWKYIIARQILSVKLGYAISIFMVVVAIFSLLCMVEAMFDKSDTVREYFSLNISLIALTISVTNLLLRFI